MVSWGGTGGHALLLAVLHGGSGTQAVGVQTSRRFCAMLPSKSIFDLSIRGMSAVSAQRDSAKFHLQECSLNFLGCNVALLTSPLLSPIAHEEQPPEITTELYSF